MSYDPNDPRFNNTQEEIQKSILAELEKIRKLLEIIANTEIGDNL